MVLVRRAFHAGSWYSADKKELISEMQDYLKNTSKKENVKAILCPHAGYAYSGLTLAHSYGSIGKSEKYKRVIVMGPSHRKYFTGCSVSVLNELNTPLGNLRVDGSVCDALSKQKGFTTKLNRREEEEEHSLELQFPWIAYLFRDRLQDISVVPLIVGDLQGQEESLAQVLKPYFDDDETLFIISSDFCHWGRRFDYAPFDKSFQKPYKYIEFLDKQGMIHIESNQPDKFREYLSQTKNTICGRNPILILMNITKNYNAHWNWNHYSQSSKAQNMSDSSVSYVSGSLSL